MCMGSFIARIFALLLASMSFFPLDVSFLPAGYNTKKTMAAVGVVVFIIDAVRRRGFKVDRGVMFCILYSCLVSLAGVFSVVWNNTGDMTYATYVMSMLTWLGAAYLSVFVIRKVEGRADVRVVGQYMVAVCLFQCITALLIDNIPAFKTWTLSWMKGFGFTSIDASASRMFGMGAYLDVGGTRFAAGLVVLAALIKDAVEEQRKRVIFPYLVSFAIILIVGCMIGRTAIVGLLFAVAYWLLTSDLFRFRPDNYNTVLKWIVLMSVVAVPFISMLYTRSDYFHENFRFGFENIFNWLEGGSITDTSSTNRLLNMFIWPDNIKTWLIGDGYFNGPGADPNFLGDAGMTDFYMWTDVGYCRFIFYFGMIGLLLFMAFFVRVGVACSGKQPRFALMFAFLVLLNFVIWIKVATDIFVMIAPFLCVDAFDEQDDETDIPSELDV